MYDGERTEWSVLTGRRSGKSWLFAALALRGAIEHHASDVVIPYFALTRKNARLYFWPILKQLVLRCGIPERRGLFGEAALTCQPFRRGATIVCLGADDRKDVELVRGGKFGPALVDECGAIPSHVLEALEDTLRPGQMDLGAPIYRGGTPGLVLAGYWYELTREDRATEGNVARWTLFDNPHMRNASEFLEQEKRRRGWTDETPSLIREYWGKWHRSTETLVYPYELERNSFELSDVRPTIDPGWSFVIGVDPGQVQETGIVVLGCHRFDPCTYVFHSEKASGLLTEQVAERIRDLQGDFRGAMVVMDVGGIGKQHAVECTRRFGIAVEPAEKTERTSAVRMLSEAVAIGRVKVASGRRCDAIRGEWSVLQWNEDKTDHSKTQRDIATNMKMDHCSDGALYAYRRLHHYRVEQEKTRPKRGTREWYEAQEAEIMRKRQEDARVA